MLYMIGIGLSDEKDISVKGLEAVKSSDFVYLENYTSKLNCSVSDLEKLYEKKVILADRELVESKAEVILEKAKDKKVSFLIIGDVFGATTHSDFYMRAIKEGIQIEVIHNASILNAIGSTGLQLYKFGKTTSLVEPTEKWASESTYDAITLNKNNGMHTLVLLNLDVKKNKYMTVNEAIKFLLQIEEKRKEKVFTEDSFCIGCARIGAKDQIIKYAKAKDILNEDFGEPLHSLIIPGELHFMEEEMLKLYE